MMRRVWAALVLACLALVMPSGEARAGESFDPAKELAYPGTRLLVVEFYSIDCKPCMAAVPKWKALHAKYRSKGLRFVVVKAEDDGRCVNLEWSPDRSICDEDDQIFKAMRVKSLPSAYVWSWTGELLVNAGHVEQVDKVVEAELVKMPRAAIHAEGSEKGLAEAERFVRAELSRAGKIQAAATAAEAKAIEAVQRASTRADRDERAQCEIGKTLGANSILTLSVGKSASPKFIVELRDASSGCTVGVGRAPWEPGNAERSAAVAVADLLAGIAKAPQMPWGARGASSEAVSREPARRAEPAPVSFGGDDDVLVSFESTPAGAKVEIDGAEACASTPCKKMVKPGKRMVSMGGACFVAKDERVVVKGDKQTVSWSLTTEKAGLRVELSDAKGEPVEGEVKLDGAVVGSTWKTLTVPACGKEIEVVAKEGGVKQSVTLRAQETTKVALRVAAPTPASPSGGGAAASGGGALLCGRYVVEDPGNGQVFSGTGLVRDTRTSLRWLRFMGPRRQNHAQAGAYCSGKGMRLPTKDEALSIAKENYCKEAWPKGWVTWTSTSAGAGLAWRVGDGGYASQDDVDGYGDGPLCVR